MAVIIEYLYFQVHVLDRLVYDMLEADGRKLLIVQLVLKLAEYIQDNGTDLFGLGEYTTAFINELNERTREYEKLSFTEAGPSYPMLRHFGYQIQRVMGDQEENRWVIDQVMDLDGGTIYQQIARTLQNLMS